MTTRPTIVQYWAGCPQFPNSKWLRILRRVQACAELGWNNVMVLSAMPSDAALVKPFADLGCEIVLHPRASRNFDAKCVWRTYRLLRENKCDLFHCQNVHTSPLIAAALARVPVRIWSKLSMSAHYETGITPKGLHRWSPSTKLSCMLAHRTLCISTTVRNELLGLGISPNKLLVTPAPVDVELYRNASPEGVREELGLNSDHSVITAVGRADYIKGWDILLAAFAKLARKMPSARLLLVGDNQNTENNQNACDILHLATKFKIVERVTFLGKRNDVPRILAASDVFAMPSRSEGMGCALIEALVAGLPIVAANVGGIPDVIEHGKNGLLYDCEDVNGLADTLGLLVQNHALRKELQFQAAASADFYTLNTSIVNMMTLYNTLLTQKGRRNLDLSVDVSLEKQRNFSNLE